MRTRLTDALTHLIDALHFIKRIVAPTPEPTVTWGISRKIRRVGDDAATDCIRLIIYDVPVRTPAAAVADWVADFDPELDTAVPRHAWSSTEQINYSRPTNHVTWNGWPSIERKPAPKPPPTRRTPAVRFFNHDPR